MFEEILKKAVEEKKKAEEDAKNKANQTRDRYRSMGKRNAESEISEIIKVIEKSGSTGYCKWPLLKGMPVPQENHVANLWYVEGYRDRVIELIDNKCFIVCFYTGSYIPHSPPYESDQYCYDNLEIKW